MNEPKIKVCRDDYASEFQITDVVIGQNNCAIVMTLPAWE